YVSSLPPELDRFSAEKLDGGADELPLTPFGFVYVVTAQLVGGVAPIESLSNSPFAHSDCVLTATCSLESA
ncbi:MAG TPA: hypothetical protein VG963_19430, partial [Polyangiaceae bacterium]|nr:hypothetical protein [Polyangiaceae bacterium]